MANIVYDSFFTNLMEGDIDLDTDNIYCAIIKDTYTPSAAHTAWSDVSGNEAATTPVALEGYIVGGGALTKSVSTNKFDATDITFTITATNTLAGAYAVIYKNAAGAAPVAGDLLICCLDLGGTKTVVAGDFTVQFHSNGILTFAQA